MSQRERFWRGLAIVLAGSVCIFIAGMTLHAPAVAIYFVSLWWGIAVGKITKA